MQWFFSDKLYTIVCQGYAIISHHIMDESIGDNKICIRARVLSNELLDKGSPLNTYIKDECKQTCAQLAGKNRLTQ